MKFKALSLLFPWSTINEESKRFVNDVSYRHDIPLGSNIPTDLLDREGTWQLTGTGFPVAGQVLAEDVGVGSTSPALPLYIGLYSLVSVLSALLPQIGLGFMFPFIVAAYFIGFVGMFGFMATVGFGLITVGAMALVPYIATPLTLVGVSSSSLVTAFSLLPAVLPLLYLILKARGRASDLAYQGSMFSNAVIRAPKSGKNNSRHIQAINAMQDKSIFIRYGTAQGQLTFNGDSFAPDKGLPVGQTENDMSTHVAFFGSTGTGKTTLLRAVLKQIADTK